MSIRRITAAFSQSHQASLDRRADDLQLRHQVRGARAFMLASAACLSIVCAVAWVHVSYAEPRAQSVGPRATLTQLVAETHPGEDTGDLGTRELRAKLCDHGAAYKDEARGCESASVDTSAGAGEDTSGQEAASQSGRSEDAETDTGAGTSGRGGTCSGGPIPESQMLNESGGDPNVTNSTGHFGCWQLAPEHYSGGMCSDLGRDVDGQRTCANRVYDAQGPGAWTAPIG